MLSGGVRLALPTLRSDNDDQEKRKRNADRRVSQPPHLAMRRAPAGALAYRRSTTALTVGAFGPWAQLQARLPWDVAGRSILDGRPNRGAKTSRSYTGVPRARLSQSRERTSRTGRS